MSIKSVAHINLRGTAREALGFYRAVYGGQLTLVSYGEAGMAHDPAQADQIIWGQVTAESGFCVMAFDVPEAMPWDPGQNAYYVSVRGDSAEEITGYWQQLSEGATIVQPLAASPWAPLYGMLKDRYGVMWVLDVAAAAPAA
ncbi:bleomycin resistance protein [Duganella sp. Leaf126]|uniref:VOC family protein n=1 Tax=Duganella sp. Leaf126 TaxID=1736266 RepID=UPI0007011D92|nr:VOC family protein [Duganella sp. Leaf126]KQQ36285.1 bleomycin resistance protein [Duganella sp. Leaf126]